MTEKEIELLRELIELVKTLGGHWVPAKPKQTIFNLGKFVVSKKLPPGKWTRVFTLPADYSPYLIYWKILVANTPKVMCLCYEEGKPVCDTGCDLDALYSLGVTSFNDRGWVHIYDAAHAKYGVQCNILRPVCGEYDFQVKNYDTVEREITVLYVKWYQWVKESFARTY